MSRCSLFYPIRSHDTFIARFSNQNGYIARCSITTELVFTLYLTLLGLYLRTGNKLFRTRARKYHLSVDNDQQRYEDTHFHSIISWPKSHISLLLTDAKGQSVTTCNRPTSDLYRRALLQRSLRLV